MMAMPEISKDDLMVVRQFLTSSREVGRLALVSDNCPAGAGALRARISGRRERLRGDAPLLVAAGSGQ